MLKYYDPEKDLGTPAVESDQAVQVIIDGIAVTVPAGTSILRAAALAGIDIPKLCATESLESFGSCRLCMVEVEGQQGSKASCTTPVVEGQRIVTNSEKLRRMRRNIMELYISDHPLNCLTCASNGDCELQDMAGAVGLREVRYGLDGGLAGKTHLDEKADQSNPYFDFNPSKCIVCSRCVRACDEIQGTHALSIIGRGFDSRVSTGLNTNFMDSDCVSCGACVQACPTETLIEKSVVEQGVPSRKLITTCGYCGVGCAFEVQLQGDQVVRMIPAKNGAANHGHSCVKGRFAFAFATHKDRLRSPMIREQIDQPWRKVGWDEAINFAAEKLKAVQARYGPDSIGGITSSRCSNEETYLVQKLIRAVFGNNNVDTCARVCHSPTGYGLKSTLGESAGTQSFDSVSKADVIMVIGANPTDAHPVFGSRIKKRLREGAQLIVIDPRCIDLVKSPHIKAAFHLQLLPGSNVALMNSLAHVLVKENLCDKRFVEERCEIDAFEQWSTFVAEERNSPESSEKITGVPAALLRGAARLYAEGNNAAIYYGLGVTEHSQGSTMVMCIANMAMATGNLGKEGAGVNPLRGQNNVQGSCDMGSFPHELPGYRHLSDKKTRKLFENYWQVSLNAEPGLRIPNMLDAAVEGIFKGLYIQGEDIAQSDPNTQHVEAALSNMDCVIIHDIFFNETAKFAHVLLPGSSFLEKNGTFINAERRISPVRKVMEPLAGKEDWQVTQALAKAMGYDMDYQHPSEIMDEIAALTPSFSGVSYQKLEELGSIQWPCNAQAPEGTPTMHVGSFVRGKGLFKITEFIATPERSTRKYPLLLTTGRILSQYNVGAQTRRTENVQWHEEDVLELHAQDAEDRGINHGDWVAVSSRAGQTVLRAQISGRVQAGVVYTTFHHPDSGANVVTTDNSDWATNCPEYKVTAVQLSKVNNLSDWQKRYGEKSKEQHDLFNAASRK